MNKIIITDDHKIFRQGLKAIITTEKLGEVIAEAENGIELLKLLPQLKPDVILMDIDMPLMNGIEATIEALKINDELKILCLTTHGDEVHYYSAIDAGARGFVLKAANINELQMAINEVANGGNYISNELLRNIISKVNNKPIELSNTGAYSLNSDEINVLLQLSKGLSNDEIVKKLEISSSKVNDLKTQLLTKTQSKNTAGLIMYAIKNNLIVVN